MRRRVPSLGYAVSADAGIREELMVELTRLELRVLGDRLEAGDPIPEPVRSKLLEAVDHAIAELESETR